MTPLFLSPAEVVTITGKSYRLKNRTPKTDEPTSGKNTKVEKKSK